MPIFNEDDDPGRTNALPQSAETATSPVQSPAAMARWFGRRLSEESIRTELCDGPVPDSPPLPATSQQPPAVSHAVSDRAELIERLKRGERCHVRHVPLHVSAWSVADCGAAGVALPSGQGFFLAAAAPDPSAAGFGVFPCLAARCQHHA